MTTTTRVPDAPDMILKELSCLDVTKVDISKISFDKLHRAIEWVFYVGNDWIDDEGYWTKGNHWGSKSTQRDLALVEFLNIFRNANNRIRFKDKLNMELPALSRRFSSGQIQDIENLLHLYFVGESIVSFQKHMNALSLNQGGIYSVDRGQFNHNGYVGHGAGDNSDAYNHNFHPSRLQDVRRMRSE